jgi:hypothetical protein
VHTYSSLVSILRTGLDALLRLAAPARMVEALVAEVVEAVAVAVEALVSQAETVKMITSSMRARCAHILRQLRTGLPGIAADCKRQFKVALSTWLVQNLHQGQSGMQA